MNASGGTVSGATSSGSLGQQASFTNSLQTFAASVAGSYSLRRNRRQRDQRHGGRQRGLQRQQRGDGKSPTTSPRPTPSVGPSAITTSTSPWPMLINGTYGPYNEDLNASLSGGTGAVVSGSVTGLISGGTNNASLQVQPSRAGPQTAGANLSLVSAGAGGRGEQRPGVTSQGSRRCASAHGLELCRALAGVLGDTGSGAYGRHVRHPGPDRPEQRPRELQRGVGRCLRLCRQRQRQRRCDQPVAATPRTAARWWSGWPMPRPVRRG